MASEDYYRREARKLYESPAEKQLSQYDHIIFDDTPAVDEAPGEGAYVVALVWVQAPAEERTNAG